MVADRKEVSSGVNSPSSHRITLGEYLKQARAGAGLSIRQLEAATGIPRTTITHLLKDRIERPDPQNLIRLARALERNPSDLFVVAGVPLPQGQPTLETLLRTDYDLPDDGIAEVVQHIDVIVDKYRRHRQDSDETRKEGTDG